MSFRDLVSTKRRPQKKDKFLAKKLSGQFNFNFNNKIEDKN